MKLIWILTTFMAFTSAAQSQNKPDIHGHRGCRGLMPENTIPAMLHALDLGVRTLEMDVVVTADKRVIVSHEPYFSHEISTDSAGNEIPEWEAEKHNIYKLRFEQTQHYDVGIKSHPRFPNQQKLKVSKPLLTNLIADVEAYALKHHIAQPFYNIEIKSKPGNDFTYHPPPDEFAGLVIEVLTQAKITDRAIIQSFDKRPLQYIRKNHPQIKLALLVKETGEVQQQLMELGFLPDIYSPEYKLVNKQMIDFCHNRGMKIIPWTVNTLPEINMLIRMGVDGIITDYPDLLKN